MSPHIINIHNVDQHSEYSTPQNINPKCGVSMGQCVVFSHSIVSHMSSCRGNSPGDENVTYLFLIRKTS